LVEFVKFVALCFEKSAIVGGYMIELDRREFLQGLGVEAMALSISGLGIARAQAPGSSVPLVKALVFDVFGTIVDWRGSIIEEGIAWGKAKQLNIDWASFADRWRAGYGPAMNKVRTGELPWTKLDDLHRMILEQLLQEFKIDGLTEKEKDHWNRVWHRLKPWPDCVKGLSRLKNKYTIAPLSNGNIAIMTDMAKNSGLPWDAILGAELVRHYKPDQEVYISAADFLGIRREEVMMVAAHSGDLKAARNCGLRTGYIYRPNELGPGSRVEKAAPGEFDIISTDTINLAEQLGA
jgi:2-haloacid dehalogenase